MKIKVIFCNETAMGAVIAGDVQVLNDEVDRLKHEAMRGYGATTAQFMLAQQRWHARDVELVGLTPAVTPDSGAAEALRLVAKRLLDGSASKKEAAKLIEAALQ